MIAEDTLTDRFAVVHLSAGSFRTGFNMCHVAEKVPCMGGTNEIEGVALRWLMTSNIHSRTSLALFSPLG